MEVLKLVLPLRSPLCAEDPIKGRKFYPGIGEQINRGTLEPSRVLDIRLDNLARVTALAPIARLSSLCQSRYDRAQEFARAFGATESEVNLSISIGQGI